MVDVTKEQWAQMSRQQRKEAGLPVSPIGGMLTSFAEPPLAPAAQQAAEFGAGVRSGLAAPFNRAAGVLTGFGSGLTAMGADVAGGAAAILGAPETSARLDAAADRFYADAKRGYKGGVTAQFGAAPAPRAAASEAPAKDALPMGRQAGGAKVAGYFADQRAAQQKRADATYSREDMAKALEGMSLNQFGALMKNMPSPAAPPSATDQIARSYLDALQQRFTVMRDQAKTPEEQQVAFQEYLMGLQGVMAPDLLTFMPTLNGE